MYFKARINVINAKKQVDERVLFLNKHSILEAMSTTRKIRGSKINLIVPITREEYEKGIDKKYKN